MKHKHRIKPGYEGGEYKEGNVVVLSPTQHAMWHFAEWQRKKNWEDRVAWQALSGLSSQEKTVAIVLSEAGKKGGAWNKDPANKEIKRLLVLGQTRSDESKAKMAVSQQQRVQKGNHPFLLQATWDREKAAAKATETRRKSCENYRIVQENLTRIVQWAKEAKTRKIRGRRPGRTVCNRELGLGLTDTQCLREILEKVNGTH